MWNPVVVKAPVKIGLVQEVKVFYKVRASDPLWPQAMRRGPIGTLEILIHMVVCKWGSPIPRIFH